MPVSLIQRNTGLYKPHKDEAPFQPYGSALDTLYAHDEEVIVAGPAGTGKSRTILEKLHILAVKYPHLRGAIVRKTRKSLTQSTLVTFRNKVLPRAPGVYFHGGDQEFRYPNGSVLVVEGLDKASKLLSQEFDIIYVAEALETTEDDWETLLTRLRYGSMPYQQIIGDTNPGSPRHWIRRRSTQGTLRMIVSHHRDNPLLYDQRTGLLTPAGVAYMSKLNRLTGVRRDRYKDGLWVQAEGVVYPQFDRETHWVKRITIPANWRRWRVVDFGYTHPFVCSWYAEDHDGRLYLYRELYVVGKLVEDCAKIINTYSQGEVYAGTITDHDAEDRATLEKYLRCATIPAHKSVSDGLQAVAVRLNKAADGRPRVFFFQDALIYRDEALDDEKKPGQTIEEFDSYIWAKDGAGRPLKDTPVKQDDHGMDTLRYMVAHLDLSRSDEMDDAVERLRAAFNRG